MYPSSQWKKISFRNVFPQKANVTNYGDNSQGRPPFFPRERFTKVERRAALVSKDGFKSGSVDYVARGEETAKKVAVYGSPRCDELKKLNEISPRSSGKREKSKRERERKKKSFFLFSRYEAARSFPRNGGGRRRLLLLDLKGKRRIEIRSNPVKEVETLTTILLSC